MGYGHCAILKKTPTPDPGHHYPLFYKLKYAHPTFKNFSPKVALGNPNQKGTPKTPFYF